MSIVLPKKIQKTNPIPRAMVNMNEIFSNNTRLFNKSRRMGDQVYVLTMIGELAYYTV